MDADKLLEDAFERLDAFLLRQAVSAGADINATDKFGEPLWDEALFDLANGYDDETPTTIAEKKDRIKSFLKEAVTLGLNLNSYSVENGGRCYGIGSVARFGCYQDLDLLQFLIDLGIDLNGETRE